MRILRTSRTAADGLFFPIPRGLRIGSLHIVALSFLCKQWATALHFNFFTRSALRITSQFSNAKSGLCSLSHSSKAKSKMIALESCARLQKGTREMRENRVQKPRGVATNLENRPQIFLVVLAKALV